MNLLFAADSHTHSVTYWLTGLLFFNTVVQSDPQLVLCRAEMGQGWGEDEVEGEREERKESGGE